MKLGRYLAVVFFAAALLAPVARAADKNQGNVTLASTAQLGGQQIKPGDYKVEWEGSGPAVEVRLLQGKKVVATSTANLVQASAPAASDQVIVRVQDSGA